MKRHAIKHSRQTISDERNGEYNIGICDDCHKAKPVRRINQVSFITRENRGWMAYSCFDCRKPIIKWVTPDGRSMETSAENPFNDDGTRKEKKRKDA